MSSLKDAKAVIEDGGCSIWGQLPDIPYKSDKFGLGFTSGAQRAVRRSQAGGPPVKITHHGVNALEDSEEKSNFEDWIFPYCGRRTEQLGGEGLYSHYFHQSIIYLSNISVGL